MSYHITQVAYSALQDLRIQVRIKSRKTQPTNLHHPPGPHQGEGFSLGNLSGQNDTVLNSTRVLPLSVTCSGTQPLNPKLEIPTKLTLVQFVDPSCDDVIEVPSADRCGLVFTAAVVARGRPSCDRWGKPAYLVCVQGSWAAVRVHAQFDNDGATATRALFTISYIVYVAPHTIAWDYLLIAYQPVPKIGKDNCWMSERSKRCALIGDVCVCEIV